MELSTDRGKGAEIRRGKKAIESAGKFGGGWSADLCENCFEALRKRIDKYYLGGNEYLKGGKK